MIIILGCGGHKDGNQHYDLVFLSAYAVQGVQRAEGVPAGGRGLPGEGQEERMLLRLRTDLGSDE